MVRQLLMGSEIIALHLDCFPAWNQSPLKRDWSILIRLETGYKRKWYPILVPLPSDSVFLCRHLLKEIEVPLCFPLFLCLSLALNHQPVTLSHNPSLCQNVPSHPSFLTSPFLPSPFKPPHWLLMTPSNASLTSPNPSSQSLSNSLKLLIFYLSFLFLSPLPSFIHPSHPYCFGVSPQTHN